MAAKLTFSAKFKRDYIAVSAVVIFFAIVAAEIALAVSIPLYIRREGAMAVEARRIRLLETFDHCRNSIRNAARKSDSDTARLEFEILSWNLNLQANYLRTEAEYLTSDEIAALQRDIDEHMKLSQQITRKPFTVERKFDTSTYVNSLIPREKR